MKFSCEAYSREGRRVTEVIEASSALDAGEILRQRGLMVSSVVGVGVDGDTASTAGGSGGAPSPRPGAASGWMSSGRRLKNLSGFLRQMSVLVSTGTPLVDAVTTLERQASEPGWRGALEEVRRRMEEGEQLSEAMASRPDCFDEVCRNLIAAGESGGRLDVVMSRLSGLVRQQQKIRGEIIGALAYPVVLVVISVVVMMSMIGFVLPRFEGLFKSIGREVPTSTQYLLNVSHFLREYWWGVVGGGAALLAGGWAFLRSETGRAAVDEALVRTPVIGTAARNLYAARIARVIGTLLDGKVGLLDCLRLSQGTVSNSLYSQRLRRAEEAVTRGESASHGFVGGGGIALFPASVIEALRSGERSGRIGPVLLGVADALDEDNELLLRSLSKMVEPMILSLLGLIVGGVTMSMFMPLFDLAAAGPMGGGAP